MFSKGGSEQSYDDLYEEVAKKHYDIETVFGTGTPAGSQHKVIRKIHGKRTQPDFVVTKVNKGKKFTRPGRAAKLSVKKEISAENFFKPAEPSTPRF